LEDIESIDGVKIAEPLSQGTGIVENQGKVKESSVEEKYSAYKGDEAGAYYTNKEYGVTVWHPGDWIVSDRDTNQGFFKAASANKPAGIKNIICVLVQGNNIMELPAVVLGSSPCPLIAINLPAENLVEMMRQNLRNSGNTALGDASIVVLNNKKFVKTEGIQHGLKFAFYNFVKGAKVYTVYYGVNLADFNTYSPVFDKIIGSVTLSPVSLADRFFYNAGSLDLGKIAGQVTVAIIVIIFLWARNRSKRPS
jgi:hypothetical protein